MKEIIPTEAGYYLAEFKINKTSELIVKVTGEAPFLKCVYWETSSNIVSKSIDASTIIFTAKLVKQEETNEVD